MNYAEELFNAVSILLDKKIESVKFDETIVATIVDASKADEGIYTVSTGGAKFIAYSTEAVYHDNDIVMVTIPQGNYENQKIIIGKQVDNLNTPMIYRSPFQNLIDISNNLIDRNLGTISYWANSIDLDEGLPWNYDLSNFKNSDVYIQSNPIWERDYHNHPLCGYTRLGIKAQFSTWLSEYSTVSGNYGLAVEIKFSIPENSDLTWSKIVIFDSQDFFGDVYNFETYYTQEQVFNIEDYVDYAIVGLRLFAYQRNNFKDIDGNYIESRVDWSAGSANIFIKDVYLCVGSPLDSFEKDLAEIYCEQGSSYTKSLKNQTYAQRTAKNKKNIFLRWIHKDDNTEIIKTAEYDDTFMSQYKILWYRYKLGAQSPDEFAGAHWEHFYGINTSADSKEDWAIQNPDNDITTDSLQIIFIPNINRESEKIKAIILKKDYDENLNEVFHIVAQSNILEFVNDTEIPHQITLIEMEALSIRYEDEEKGHYFLYNEAGDIGKNEDGEVRILTAVFDEQEHNVYEKSLLQINECESIQWIFPDTTANTMIVPMTDITSDALPATPDANGQYIFTDVGQVGFTIKNHLNNAATQNTIRLEIIKDGINYTAQIQPVFGTAGLNGSDYTLILTWLDGKNGLDISESTPNLQGELTLFDQAGNVLEWPEDAIVTCDWEVIEISGQTATKQKEKESSGIFYPVFRSANYAIMYGQNNTTKDNGYQNTYFYYFVDSNIGSSGHQDYYYFDLIEKRFKHLEAENFSDSNADNYYTKLGQLYQKSTTNTVKNKLEFRPVKFTANPLNEETGIISYNSDMVNASIHRAITVNNDIKEYYYSPEQRYFIKYEDRYIIDPWKEYQEVETYYEPIEAKEVIYTNKQGQNTIAGTLTATVNNINQRLISITANNIISMNSLFILRITLSNFGDYDLTTFYPIPLKNNQLFTVDYIEGPDRVRYDSSGTLDFNKNPYQITARQQQGDNVIIYRHGYPQLSQGVQQLNGYWQLLIANRLDPFKPTLNETAIDNSLATPKVKDVIDDHYDIPILSPPSVYIPDATAYGVQFIYTLDDNPDHDIALWTQPILVYESRYPSRTLNKWNGKDIITDNDAGTITASGFSAGKKERDNSFTGVVIGDWSRSIVDTVISKNTGIYGFYQGAMSYAFKDDGTGFIGKDGSGRIYLDGNKSQIYSSKWANQDIPQGMLLDIDDGYLKMQSTELIYKPARKSQSLKSKYFSILRYGSGTHTIPIYIEGETLHTYIELSENDEYNIESIYYKAISDGYEQISAESARAQFKKLTYKRFTPDGVNATAEALYIKDNQGIYHEVNYQDEYVTYDSSNSTSYYEASPSGKKYITIGSNQKTYPLSIGVDTEVSQRPFRVTWDGKAYITDGVFDGHITARSGDIYGVLTVHDTISGGEIRGASIYATRLEVNNGLIGGWEIGESYLRDTDHTTILSSNNGGSITTSKGVIGGWTIANPKFTSTNGTTVLNANPDSAAELDADKYNIITSSAKIGGWIVDGNSFSSTSGNTVLKSSPTSNEANITTEYIKVSKSLGESQSASGIIGYIAGTEHALIGIKSDNVGLAFEAGSDQPIKLSGPGTALASAVYVHGDTVEIGKRASSQIIVASSSDITIKIADTDHDKYIKIFKNSSDNKVYFDTNIPAEQQRGIYARFA